MQNFLALDTSGNHLSVIASKNGRTERVFLENCAMKHAVNVMPAIDQLETNVFSQQTKMRELLSQTGTKAMAWGPMAQGKENFFDHEVLKTIGAKYGKTASQVGLRFLVQQGIPAIPKTTDVKRMKENIDIFDFVLDEEDMTILMTLNLHDKGTRDYTDLTYASRIIAQKF